jgi:CRP-like cAMP-binding protein
VYQQLRVQINRYQPITDSDWALIAPCFHYQLWPRGSHILSLGDRCTHFHFMSKGAAHVYILQDGKQLTGQFFLENHFFTEMNSLITGEPSLFAIEAVEDCQLLSIQAAELEGLYERSANFLRFGKQMSDLTSIWLIQRYIQLLSLPAIDRYRHLLKERPGVLRRFPLYLIASYLGVSPEALSRIRRQMAKS